MAAKSQVTGIRAAAKALKLTEAEVRALMDGRGALREAFDASVAALPADPKWSATVAIGRALAAQIDDAIANGMGQEVTKALYLAPHLMAVLAALKLTPASAAEPEPEAKPASKLAALKGEAGLRLVGG